MPPCQVQDMIDEDLKHERLCFVERADGPCTQGYLRHHLGNKQRSTLVSTTTTLPPESAQEAALHNGCTWVTATWGHSTWAFALSSSECVAHSSPSRGGGLHKPQCATAPEQFLTCTLAGDGVGSFSEPPGGEPPPPAPTWAGGLG